MYISMPYKKGYSKFRKRRRFVKKSSSWNRWFQKGVTPKEAIDYAVSGVSYLKGLVNAEMLKYDISPGLNVTGEAGYVLNCQAIATGDSDAGRTGNSILARSFNFDGFVNRPTGGDAVQQVRVSLVQDSQQIGDTAPAINDVYEDLTPYSKLNRAHVGRFKILWSKQYLLDNAKSLGAPVKINVPMRHHIRYNGGASGDIQKGGLWLMVTTT